MCTIFVENLYKFLNRKTTQKQKSKPLYNTSMYILIRSQTKRWVQYDTEIYK